MKTQEELRAKLNSAYAAAAEQAGVESWNKFAEFVGIPYPTIYRIVNNKSKVTENMVRRVYTELAIKGITVENSPIAFDAKNVQNVMAQNVGAPVTQNNTDERWFDLVAEKDAQINRLLGIIEKMHS